MDDLFRFLMLRAAKPARKGKVEKRSGLRDENPTPHSRA